MKKKIILTCLIGCIVTFFIYRSFDTTEMNILALGDSMKDGETTFNISGYSFNDYLKDYYEKESILKEYITEFTTKEDTTDTLKMKINNNYTLESTNISIQQAIAKAKIITLWMGMDELNNKKEIYSKDYEKYLQNMEIILKILRVYNDKQIFLISLYPSKKIPLKKISPLNERLKIICDTYNINFINIENITSKKEYFFDTNSYQLNYKGHRYISEKIIEYLT